MNIFKLHPKFLPGGYAAARNMRLSGGLPARGGLRYDARGCARSDGRARHGAQVGGRLGGQLPVHDRQRNTAGRADLSQSDPAPEPVREYRMKPDIKLKLDSIFSYPFFRTVGRPLPSHVSHVDNWQAAAKSCSSKKWNACHLMARNTLQRLVEKNGRERIQDWNMVIKEIRPIIHTFVDKLIAGLPVTDKSKFDLKHDLSWDFMFICLEYEYRDVVEPLFFIPVVDPWYAAGHFPCGWDGDEFPDGWDGVVQGGQLIVF